MLRRREKDPMTAGKGLSARKTRRLRGTVENARRGYNYAIDAEVKYPTSEVLHGLGVAALMSPLIGGWSLAAGAPPFLYWALTERERQSTIYRPRRGYGIQTFSVSDGEKAEARMAVLPRRYDNGERESEEQRRRRLAVVADIAAKTEPDHVVVPDELLGGADAGDVPLNEALYPHRPASTVASPFDDDATGRLFTPEELKEFLESEATTELREWEGKWDYIRDVVAQRFPRVEMSEDDGETLRSIAGYMRREVQNMPGTYRESLTDSQGRRLFAREKKTLSRSMRLGSSDGRTVIEGKDSHHMVVESHDLHDGVQAVIANPGAAWEADTLTLLDAAHFTLAKATASRRGDKMVSEKEHEGKAAGRGRKPAAFESSVKEAYRQRVKRMLGMTAVVLPVVIGGSYVSEHFHYEPHNNNVKVIGEAVSAAPLWKLEEHGMSGKGYYADSISYHLDTKTWTWRGVMEKARQTQLPSQLGNLSVPHLTLSHYAISDKEVKLPIRAGTEIAALRVTKNDGTPGQFGLYKSADGIYEVKFGEKTSALVQYDLVEAGDATWGAQAPLEVDEKPESESIRSMRLENGALRRTVENESFGKLNALRSYIAKNYAYSNNELVKIDDVHDVQSFVNRIDAVKKVNCNYAATQFLSLYMAMDERHTNAGYVTGYKIGDGEKFLYQGHAFVAFDGAYMDPTPAAPKGANVGLDEKSPHELEKEWKGKNERFVHGPNRLPYVLAAGGLSILAAYGAQRQLRKRHVPDKIKRAYHEKRAAGIDPEKAARHLGWLNYGTYGSKVGGTAPALGNISDETLQDVAKGEYPDGPLSPEEAKALRHFAKAARAERAVGRKAYNKDNE